MDSNSDPPSTDKGTAVSKPLKDAVTRNYRRRPPVTASSSSDGSPEHNNRSSPKHLQGDPREVFEHQPKRKDDGNKLNRDSERSHCGRSSDSYRNSDRQSRNSKDHYLQIDHIKDEKHADVEERISQKSTSRLCRESSGSTRFDNVRSRDHSRYLNNSSQDKFDGSEHRNKDKNRGPKFFDYQKYKDDSSSERLGSGRSVGHFEDMEWERDRHRADRGSQDEKRDYHRSSRDFRSERSYEESRGHQSDSISRRDDGKLRESEGYKSHLKEMDDEKIAPKRPKFSNWDKGIADSKFTTTSEGRESSSSKQIQNDKLETDINAAKVAAMKAAESVNRNLAGAGPAGCLTADQKKKLLWGNKKNTTTEEAGHRWDTTLFPDRERQEKFKKLMSLKLPWCLWPIVGCEGRAQPRQPRGHQSSQSRAAEGTPAGFREAIYSWTAKERWPHCWFRSLSILRFYCTMINIRIFL
ncbi:uncharacterized protein LOC126782363 isoform X2 [Argentina anserina]|uniref:uncharacterized protein LOC126782363 isoform X2 n=1 Tax=Argentina anserina TaxID=57926 RepID=UPI002176882D|nr:uncharacterized protein LOC126782363 isoform X2 [Potentilla anserina]